MQVKRIRHAGIVVKDLDESLVFYRDYLGFSIKVRALEEGSFIDEILGLQEVVVETVKLECGMGDTIELLDYRTQKRDARCCFVNDIGITHLAFEVAELDCLFRSLQKVGIEFIAPPRINPEGSVRVAFCRAPEGTFIELVEKL